MAEVKVKYLIKYKDLFLNIKPSKKLVKYVTGAREAKGYGIEEAKRLLKDLIELNILEDKDIAKYILIPKKDVLYKD